MTALNTAPLAEHRSCPKRSAGSSLFIAAFILTLASPVIVASSQAIGIPHIWIHPTIGLIPLSALARRLLVPSRRARQRLDGAGLLLSLAVLAYAVAAYRWSPQADFARDKAISILFLCLLPGLALAAATLDSDGHERRTVQLAKVSRGVLALALLALLGLGQAAAGGRFALGQVNPIWLARGLVMLGIAASVRTSRTAPAWGIAVALACVGIGSRSAAFVMLAVLAHGFRSELRAAASSSRGFGLVRTALSIAVAGGLTYYLMIVGILRAPDDFTAVARSRLWEAAVHQLRYDDSLIVGQGLAAFRNFKPSVYGYPHNLLLELLLDVGMVGMTIMLWSLRRSLKTASGILPICLMASFALAMTSGDFAGNGAFFTLLIACNAVQPTTNMATSRGS